MSIRIDGGVIREFALYGLVGLFTMGVYFVLFFLIFALLNYDYRYAVSISYLAAVIFHFTSNKLITFRRNDVLGAGVQLARYFVLVIVNYLITIFIVGIAVELFAYPPYVGILLAILATVISGYMISKFWVFGR